MKRITLLLVGLLSLPFFSYSGGIVHNTNQSASWVRMFARDASRDIDAVFYNPAGLTKLDDGFYISINNQTLSQNRTITSNYTYLDGTPKDYEGSISAPIFPGLYAAYKTGKFAFSLGINPVGGGGGATFNKGLPAFEMGISDLVPILQGSLLPIDQGIEAATSINPGFSNITSYSADIFFEGTSVFWGFQLNGSYEINDMFSIAIGARYISAKNTYSGHIKNIKIDAPSAYGGTQTPGNYLRIVAGTPGLDALTVATLQGTATVLDAQTTDINVDVTQTGTGFTPIIGVNVSPNEKVNIALKYEFPTKLELENETKVDGSGLFPDKEKNRMDLPGFLTAGLDYKITDKLNVATGFHYWFDKSADYGHKDASRNALKNEDIIDKNYWEWNLGVEYVISEKILVSAGYNRTQTGVKEEYQSDLDYSLSSNSVGLGGVYSITPNIGLTVAVAYTKYVESTKDLTHYLGGNPAAPMDVTETYNKDNMFFGLGLDFKFGGKKSE